MKTGFIVCLSLIHISRTGTFRFPVDGLVQLYHTLLAGGTADKPAIQRVVQHRFVRTPAMRIVVHVLLYLESVSYTHLDVYKRQGFVVTRLRNISTAITDCPKRYNNTIWNAPKNRKVNNIQKVLPQFPDQLIIM